MLTGAAVSHILLAAVATSSGGARMTYAEDSARILAEPPPHTPTAPTGMGSGSAEHVRASAALVQETSSTPFRTTRAKSIPTPADLRFRLLGAPEVQAAGAPLILHNQKAQALLFYLAATSHPQTRDHLATLLWSESPDSNARHSLRSSLYHLRQALLACGASGRLEVQRNLVYLRLREDECDVARLDSL